MCNAFHQLRRSDVEPDHSVKKATGAPEKKVDPAESEDQTQ
jgi:hypothetical protein